MCDTIYICFVVILLLNIKKVNAQCKSTFLLKIKAQLKNILFTWPLQNIIEDMDGCYLWGRGRDGVGWVHKLTSKGRFPSPISKFESPLNILSMHIFERWFMYLIYSSVQLSTPWQYKLVKDVLCWKCTYLLQSLSVEAACLNLKYTTDSVSVV